MTAGTTRLSLRRQLLLWLLLPQLVLWAGGGLLAYRIALSYAEKAIDQSLTQSVRALARQVKPIGSGLLIDFPRAAQDVLEQDPKDRISYMVSSPPGQFLLGNQRLPQPAAGTGGTEEPLLYASEIDGKPLRIVALDVNYGEDNARQTLRVQVGKSLAVQQRIARELIADMLAPLLAAGVLLSLAVYGGIQRGLAPLTRLTAQLENRSVNALSPIGMTQAPNEVHALVQAINGLLDEVAREWTPRAVAAGVDLGFEGEEHRQVQGDALQLREAMANLIDNALRYTPSGSAVTLKVEVGGERTRLLVEDNGPGLSDVDMTHVFQRFWRASEQPGGCGLGLAIVSEIARRHGGEARAERVSPQGFRVVLTLV